jgi:hypothetical protein
VHLLLASQRLEEGRLRGLDTHPSAGLMARNWSRLGQLAAPIGIIDRPFE